MNSATLTLSTDDNTVLNISVGGNSVSRNINMISVCVAWRKKLNKIKSSISKRVSATDSDTRGRYNVRGETTSSGAFISVASQ